MSGYNIHPLPPNTIHFAPLKPSIHPRLEIQLNSTLLAQTSIAAAAAPLNDHAEASAKASCTTHMHIQLPDALFIDRDELLDLWSTSSRITEWELRPEIIDIERPVRLVDGVSLCLVVGDEVDELDIPLHARYLVPSELGYTTVQILEYGDFRAGLVCAKQSSSSKHIRDLPIYPVQPLSITLPTGIASHQPFVEGITTATIWLGFAWLVYKIIKLQKRLDRAARVSEKKKTS